MLINKDNLNIILIFFFNLNCKMIPILSLSQQNKKEQKQIKALKRRLNEVNNEKEKLQEEIKLEREKQKEIQERIIHEQKTKEQQRALMFEQEKANEMQNKLNIIKLQEQLEEEKAKNANLMILQKQLEEEKDKTVKLMILQKQLEEFKNEVKPKPTLRMEDEVKPKKEESNNNYRYQRRNHK